MVHWRTFLDSDVIRYVDLNGNEYTLQIKKVQKGKVTGSGGKSSGKGMIWFEGREKPLGAGTAILSTIASLYGNDTRQWPGKWITIYPDPNVTFGKEKVGGVRVRPVIPKEQGQSGRQQTAKGEPGPIDLNEALEIQQREAEEARRGR